MTKRILLSIFFGVFILLESFGQMPQGIYYQAVVRNSAGNLVQSQPVSFRFTIHDGSPIGTVVYQQTDTVVTDQMGLITVVLGGGGSVIQGNFGQIPWAVGGKFMETELDPAGGTNYTNMGTTQMLSVPYALVSGKALNADSTWTKSGNNIYNANPGNVGINNPNPATELDVHGYSALGENSPQIKMTKVTGVTPSIVGGTTSVNLGIPDSSILSIDVIVGDTGLGIIKPQSILSGKEYSYSVTGSVLQLTLTLANSAAILSKPFRALVFYQR